MPEAELARLQREFIATGGMVGDLIYEVVVDVTRTIVFSPRYQGLAPQVTRAGSWDEVALDIAHNVIVDDLLLGPSRYIDHVFAVARSLDGFRGLIGARVHRSIKRMRDRSVIDVLLDRARPVLENEPFASFDRNRNQQPDGFQLSHRAADIEKRDATEDELARVAREVSVIPTLTTHATERSPRVYGKEELHTLLITACGSMPALLYVDGLRSVLQIVLTDWTVGRPVPVEEAMQSDAADLDPAVSAVERESARTFLALLDDDEAELLRQMLAGYRDQESADHFGCSRQTINGRRGRIREQLRQVVQADDIEGGVVFLEELHVLVVERMVEGA